VDYRIIRCEPGFLVLKEDGEVTIEQRGAAFSTPEEVLDWLASELMSKPKNPSRDHAREQAELASF
jgi:hypothetical protein